MRLRRNPFAIAATSLLVSLLVSSCGSTGDAGPEAVASSATGSQKQKTLEDFQFKKGTDVVYGKPGTPEEGMIVGGRRSQYEGRRQGVFGGEFKGKQFQTNAYKANAWDGTKDFGRQSYSGNTVAGENMTGSSSMARVSNRDAQRRSREAGNIYGTNSYATAGARESAAAPIQGQASRLNDDNFQHSSMNRILSGRDYQRLTIQETNALLGR